jgi:hypothetical protein
MLPKDLNQIQISGLVGLGVVYWGAAALTVRYAGHVCYANDLRRLSMFMSTIPIGYIVMRFSEGLLGISSKQRLITTAIMCSSALLLDGIAFMWFPTLYENPKLKQKNPSSSVILSRMGAAWILGGVGVCLGIALLTQ